jgi:hypothetical protein
MLNSQAADRADVSDENELAMAETAGQQIFQRLLPGCNAAAERC